MNEDRNKTYAEGVLQHAREVNDLLATFPPDVQAFMRKRFDLTLYPQEFTRDFATALNEFRPPSPAVDPARVIEALRERVFAEHDDATHWPAGSERDGHKGEFDACPHDDCVLVRAALTGRSTSGG